MPRPLAFYIAFARELRARFDDHAWLVETLAGDPVAAACCWSNSAGDSRVMECDVLVVRERRRQGIGSRLLGEIAVATAAEGRSLLTWSTFDSVPAGEAFSRQVGAGTARVNRTSELRFDEVDWAMVGRWADAPRPRDLGYRTDNAVSNASMLAINDALGFSVTRTRTEWQADVGAVRQALDVESR